MASRVAANPYRFEKDGLNLSDRDWSERILFKENVEGPFGVLVQVSGSASEAEKIAHLEQMDLRGLAAF
jgi:hypothetical protein